MTSKPWRNHILTIAQMRNMLKILSCVWQYSNLVLFVLIRFDSLVVIIVIRDRYFGLRVGQEIATCGLVNMH